MTEYRICFVTPDGHIAAAPLRFACDNDLDAVQHARTLVDRNVIQLWQGRRLVTRIKSNLAA
jgi:hypothetical protein